MISNRHMPHGTPLCCSPRRDTKETSSLLPPEAHARISAALWLQGAAPPHHFHARHGVQSDAVVWHDFLYRRQLMREHKDLLMLCHAHCHRILRRSSGGVNERLKCALRRSVVPCDTQASCFELLRATLRSASLASAPSHADACTMSLHEPTAWHKTFGMADTSVARMRTACNALPAKGSASHAPRSCRKCSASSLAVATRWPCTQLQQ